MVSVIDNDNVIAEKEAVTEDNKDPKYYLAQLPFSEEEQLLAHTLIEESLFEMGIIFCRDLENLNVSIKTLMDVERRYPESLHMLDIYYEIYLMYMRMNDTYNASVYKNKIISTFPESSYAIALSDPNYIEKLRNMDKLQEELYAETYQCYLDGNTSKVHANYVFVKANWPLSKLMPKFMFLDALSYVPENRVGEFKTTLEQLTATYCESDVAPLAGLMIKEIGRAHV